MSEQRKLMVGYSGIDGEVVFLRDAVFEGAGAGTCDLREGSPSGTIKATLRLGAAGQVVWRSPDPVGVAYRGGLYATLSGGTVTVSYGAQRRLGGEWAPTNIDSLVAWYDFADPAVLYTDTALTTPVTTDGEAIAGVRDKSFSVRNLTQATALNRPIYKENIIDGSSVARFTTANGTVLTGAIAGVQSGRNGPFSVFFIASRSTSDANNYAVMNTNGGGGFIGSMNNSPSAGGIDVYGDSRNYSSTKGWSATGTFYQFCYTFDAQFDSYLWRDGGVGELKATATTPTQNPNVFYVSNTGAAGWNGDILQALWFNSILTRGELNALGNYFKTRLPSLTWVEAT